MAYKTILTVIDANQFDADLKMAADLCIGAGVHLSVFMVRLTASRSMGDYAAMSVAWVDERTGHAEQLDNAIASARATLIELGVSSEVSGAYAEPAWVEDEVGDRARYADVTLIGSGLHANARLRLRAVEGALFHGARPVVLASTRQALTLVPKKILLAWNSTIEATRAAREALEMMKHAEVNVVLVDPKADSARNGDEPGADVATYLARHGIRITVSRLSSAGLRVDEVLNHHALDTSAELIVMGAYGHSRMREKILGGVTKAMIDNPVVPVLLVR